MRIYAAECRCGLELVIQAEDLHNDGTVKDKPRIGLRKQLIGRLAGSQGPQAPERSPALRDKCEYVRGIILDSETWVGIIAGLRPR